MKSFPKFWKKLNLISLLLFPLSLIFLLIIILRRKYIKAEKLIRPAKIIVVGNITVGGNGKTPTIIALCEKLSQEGKKIAVISRGYGGKNNKTKNQEVIEIYDNSSAEIVGDEAILLQNKLAHLDIKIAVARKRIKAANYLLAKYPDIEIIISDDGLQHYYLPRDFELILIAPDLLFGNNLLLPAGPLREPKSRINQAQAIATFQDTKISGLKPEIKQFNLTTHIGNLYRLTDNKSVKKEELEDKKIILISSIARPERILNSLEKVQIEVNKTLFFPDHENLSSDKNLSTISNASNNFDYIILTEKDAVKTDKWQEKLRQKTLVIPYKIIIPDELLKLINQLFHSREH
ncbi:MAG: tetraacyldisaccharide 4'-kinase [Cardiobacteriaceae bacterium]|nr:tetraacyldisaccharide 4'-kinase [Cardiobacteriaceae bacterium]